VVQSAHACPWVPQAAFARPSWQTPLASQQPVGHVVALHGGTNAQYEPGSLQARPSAVQFSHAAPAAPHTEFVVPGRHTPFASQHPPQVMALHAVTTPPHLPLVHADPDAEQMAQAPPPMPQASVSLPSRQRPRVSQQPAQVAAHVGAVP
jgi:hypothetical protein